MLIRARLAVGLLAAVVLAGVACNGVLGIDAATVDPTLGDGGTATASACSAYCATVQANCTGGNQEYIDVATCTAMCLNFEPGTPGDTTQDSLSCRIHYANLAASDPTTNCRSAGPLGGSCGNEPCTAFCGLDINFCGNLISPPYATPVDCVTACQSDSLGAYLADAGDIALSSGNSLNCRIYHLESAFEPANPSAKAFHCPHTGVSSATCFAAVPDAGSGGGSGADAGDAGDGGG